MVFGNIKILGLVLQYKRRHLVCTPLSLGRISMHLPELLTFARKFALVKTRLWILGLILLSISKIDDFGLCFPRLLGFVLAIRYV